MRRDRVPARHTGRMAWGAVLVALVATLGVLSGCAPAAGAASGPTTRRRRAPTRSIPAFPSSIWGRGVECGYLSVPENRAHPDGRRIR